MRSSVAERKAGTRRLVATCQWLASLSGPPALTIDSPSRGGRSKLNDDTTTAAGNTNKNRHRNRGSRTIGRQPTKDGNQPLARFPTHPNISFHSPLLFASLRSINNGLVRKMDTTEVFGTSPPATTASSTADRTGNTARKRKRPRAVQACERCRNKKYKCDELYPTCSHCISK